ncbi:MAG TPA: sigma-70 family RNA polymerase sigma factor [Gemmataceae bacterium]
MRHQSTDSLLHHLRRAVLTQAPDGLTDAQLLEAFLVRHEESAFTALVRRHGPLVLGVCRRVLGDRHEAEDAFQATFLVLLRKARSIQSGRALGPWLYGVAHRTSRRARDSLARRRAAQKRIWERARQSTQPARDGEDWRPLLDEELSRLPEKYRAAIVLCDLQGRTHKEAARELGWPQGTLSGRLWRGRALLARRLRRRGLTLSAIALTLASGEDAAFAAVAAPLVGTTACVAQRFVEGGAATSGAVSARIAALTQGVLKAMWMTKVRTTAALLLIVSVGIGGFLCTTGTQAQPGSKEKETASSADVPTFLARRASDDVVPKAEDLVRYLNDNAKLIPALRCTNVLIECKADRQTVGLPGQFLYQKPGNFRFTGKVFSQPAFDMGSNREQVWYWISKNDPPYLFWVSRKDLASGKAHLPLPFWPEWFGEVMGTAEWDISKPRTVIARGKSIELIEPIVTPQGQHGSKVIVFARMGTPIQVTHHLLRDNKGKVICEAAINKVRQERKSVALLVEDVKFTWPAQRLEARLQFTDIETIEPLSKERVERVFSPDGLGYQRYSLVTRSLQIDEEKQADAGDPLPTDGIRIDLTTTQAVLRHGEEVLKLSGRPDRPLALGILQDQLRAWADKEKQVALCVTSSPSVEYAVVKAVLDACRQAGIRKIELRTAEK